MVADHLRQYVGYGARTLGSGLGLAGQAQQGRCHLLHLLPGPGNPVQAGAGTLGESGLGKQHFHGPLDHRQRRAQLVAHVGREATLPVDEGPQAAQVEVEGASELAHLVVGKVPGQRCQRVLRRQMGHPSGQLPDRKDHPSRQP